MDKIITQEMVDEFNYYLKNSFNTCLELRLNEQSFVEVIINDDIMKAENAVLTLVDGFQEIVRNYFEVIYGIENIVFNNTGTIFNAWK